MLTNQALLYRQGVEYIICIVQADNASRVLVSIILFIILLGGFKDISPSGGILSTTVGES